MNGKATVLSWCVSGVCLLLLLPSMAVAKQVILVIESYHAEYPWDASYKKGLEEVLGREYELRYFEMNTKQLPPEEHARRADMAWKLYQDVRPALVVLGDDAALKFLGPRFLQTQTPCVYLGVNANPREYIENGRNVTGVLERPLFLRNIVFLKSILPRQFRKALVLFDTDITSRVLADEPFGGKGIMDISGVQVELRLIGQLDQWKRAVLDAKANGYDVIIVGLYHTIVDSDGKHVDSEEILHWTSENSPVPLFGFWDFAVGPKATAGGMVLFGEVQGRMAGEIARTILSGTPPGQILPVIGEQGRFLFSRSQLAKWGLTLPKDISDRAEFVE